MKYAVIGMGAIGGYYGCRLAQSGHDVHFLLRSDYGHVVQHGFAVDSFMGDFCLDHLQVYDSSSRMPQCDVVLVCLKTTANHLLPSLLSPILKPTSLIVLVQNGIGVEAAVQEMFPHHSIAAGVAFINAAKTGPGRIIHKGYGHITLCDFSCADLDVLSTVVSDFNSSQVKARIADYAEARWTKNILNMATNGVTVVLNARCDQLIANPDSCRLVRELMLEGIRAAQVCGVASITEELADKLIENTRNTQFATSMKYDFDHHLPLEIEYMYTRPLEQAELKGCPLPRLRQLEQQLLFLDSANR